MTFIEICSILLKHMSKGLVILAVLAGLALLGLSFVYFTTPADALPSFLPGHDLSVTRIHLKHAVAAVLLGLACFAFAWFQSGKKTSVMEKNLSSGE